LVFGPEDGFTTGLAKLLHALPVFFLPGEGDTLMQPISVDDLVMAMIWAIDLPKTVNQTYELGGLEQLSFRQVVEILAAHMGLHRRMVSIPPPYLRAMTVFLEHSFPGFPLSVYWLDYFAVNRTCSMDTLPKQFGLLPTRFAYGLDYLDGRKWGREFWKTLFLRRR
jgi:NADH dehydrogenase